MAELLNLPTLPEGYIWKIDFSYDGDYTVEVYRRIREDPGYTDETLIVSQVVKNEYATSINQLQTAVDNIAVKINRGVQVIAAATGATT